MIGYLMDRNVILRPLFRPWGVFNQYSLVLMVGLFVAVGWIETSVGYNSATYRICYRWLYSNFGISWKVSLWILVASKLLLVLLVAQVVGLLMSTVGKIFGKVGNPTVFQRRVSTLLLLLALAQSMQLMGWRMPTLRYLSLGLFLWVIVLSFVTVQELFQFDIVRTVILFLIGVFLVVGAYRYSGRTSYLIVSSFVRGKVPGIGHVYKQSKPRSKHKGRWR